MVVTNQCDLAKLAEGLTDQQRRYLTTETGTARGLVQRGTEAIWIGAMQLAREQGVIRPGRQTLGQHIAEGCGDD